MSLREEYEDILNSYEPPEDDYDYWESGPPLWWDDEPEQGPDNDEEARLSEYNARGNW